MVPAVCSIELWVWGTRSHLQRPTVPVPKTKQEDTHIPFPGWWEEQGQETGLAWGGEERSTHWGHEWDHNFEKPWKTLLPLRQSPPTAIAVPLFPTHPIPLLPLPHITPLSPSHSPIWATATSSQGLSLFYLLHDLPGEGRHAYVGWR